MGAMDVKIRIETPIDEFTNDLADVIRIFFGEGATDATEAPDGFLCHRHTAEGEEFQEVCVLTVGDASYTGSAEGKVAGSAVERKRLFKRLVKRACYSAMTEFTGRHPAWGSLTGIRPTRLLRQAMERGMDLPCSLAELRDTFDVSEEKLGVLSEVIASQGKMYREGIGACDLYIGIPFCTTRCSYCSFSAGTIGNGKQVEPYLQALMKELAAGQRLAAEAGFKIRTAYIGGGTPSSLRVDQMEKIIDAAERLYGPFEEFTVEAGRPDTLDEEKLSMMKNHSITRISINPQTMNDETLARIGRAHTSRKTVEVFTKARQMGYDDINMDVIAALPGENESMFAYTLEQIRKLSPDSLTVHTLAIKRSSRLHESGYRPEQEASCAAMVEMGREAAHSMGMHAYYLYRQKYMAENLENVGYCTPGRECRYNIDNMEETANILAFGACAISKFIPVGEERIVRAPNLSNIEQYTARVDELVMKKEKAYFESIRKSKEENNDSSNFCH